MTELYLERMSDLRSCKTDDNHQLLTDITDTFIEYDNIHPYVHMYHRNDVAYLTLLHCGSNAITVYGDTRSYEIVQTCILQEKCLERSGCDLRHFHEKTLARVNC